MNTPIPHRVTELKATVDRLGTMLHNAEPEALALLGFVKKQIEGIDRQLSLDREEASNRRSDDPGFMDVSVD